MCQSNDNWHVVYKSDNFLIRFVGQRFLLKVNKLLRQINSDKKIGVEIGCGEAHLLNFLRKNDTIRSIFALDLSAQDLGVASTKYPYFDYIRGDAESTPFFDDAYDFVILLEVLEHVDNPRKVLEEICRITKPGANILISVPNEPFFHLSNLLRGKYIGRCGKTPNHQSFWTVPEFSRLLNEYFVVVEKHYFSVFPWQLYLCRSRKN